MLLPLGKLNPTPGTPVRATANLPNPAAKYACHGILIQACKGNAGVAYVGDSTLVKGAQTGLLGELAIPTANTIPSWSAALTLAPNAIDASQVYVDVDTNGDGVIVSVLVA